MMKNKTRKTISEELATRLKIRPDEAQLVTRTVIDIFTEALVSGHPIEIRYFGTLRPVKRNARKGRKVLTGESVAIPARIDVKFSASDKLKKLLNQKT
jgi:integration host factor subunit beta